jgi:hypothetical protein
MSNFLRQSTASQARTIGPFLDDTDFKTAETALTIANTDIKLLVNGGASANKNSGGGTHRVNGMYGVTFDATDTATVGELEVSVVVAGALPVFKTFYVLEEAVFDALFAAAAPGYVANAPVNVAQMGGTAYATAQAAEVDAIWDKQVDGSVTARQSMRLANSANGGKTSGGGTTTFTMRDLADTKDRVVATVDANGNRSAATRDLS